MLLPHQRNSTNQRARPLLAIDVLERRTLFSFGLTTTSSTYTVDTGAGLTFTIIRTQHPGDLSSVKLNGNELLAPYAQTSRYSHFESGLSTYTAVTAAADPNGQWILITCDDTWTSGVGVIQYYIAKKGDNDIYLASLPNGGSEARFITYLNKSIFSQPEASSDLTGNSGAIEGSDVYGFADGTTASKFYTPRRMIDNIYHGVTGTVAGQSVGAWMFMGNREHSSGGPFFKDIDFQSSSAAVEMYNYLYSGHTQTEAFRPGLQGPYAMQFTNGSTPTLPDYSFLDNVGISGLVPASGRGAISGTASGMISGHQTTIGLSSGSAQYWAYADASTGSYNISGVLPGDYTETFYDEELVAGSRTITVTAGNTTRANIVNASYTPTATWRIGTWDGTPAGFLNADKIGIMHPSDVRMSSWTSVSNFIIGTNTDSQWPMAQFMGVNNSQRITFTLTAAQAAQAQTLRIGITLGFAGARNQITVNAGQSYTWSSAIPAASINLNSRGVTRGTYRGNNQLYTYNIPTSAFRAGTNTIDIPLRSGSYTSGQTWLSPNVVYDAIDLIPTTSLTNAPKVTKIVLSPATRTLGSGKSETFAAIAYDQNNKVMPANVTFSSARGLIDDTGYYVAPASGTDTVTATVATVSGMAAITIDSTPPTITGVVSRKTHGSAGVFDRVMAFGGNVTPTVEPRAGGATTLIYTFSEPVSPVDGTLSANEFVISNASFSSAALLGSTLTLNLSGVADQTRLSVSLNGIQDTAGNALTGTSTLVVRNLYGDANGNGVVNASDVALIKSLVDQSLSSVNFFGDLNVNGVINASDVALVKSLIDDNVA